MTDHQHPPVPTIAADVAASIADLAREPDAPEALEVYVPETQTLVSVSQRGGRVLGWGLAGPMTEHQARIVALGRGIRVYVLEAAPTH